MIYTLVIQRKIILNIDLSPKQKTIHSILIWLIPFLWYYLVKDLMKTDKGPMTRSKRDKLKKDMNGGFYESGVGTSGE